MEAEVPRGVRVYRFGLLRPTVEADRVHEQIRLAARYRNTLTEIERGRRAAVRALHATVGDLAAAEDAYRSTDARVGNAARAIKLARAAARGRAETTEMRDALREAKAAKTGAGAALREIRRRIREDEAIIQATAEIEERANELKRSARAHCGVYWGTYLLVEAAADQARKTLPLYDGLDANDPTFSRFNGEGSIGVQIQKGLTSQDIFAVNNLVQIDPVDERAWGSPIRGERRRYSRTTLRIRVGSGKKGRPIWAAFPMVMHRALPEGTIKNVSVSVRRIGPREEWSCQLTVSGMRDQRVRPDGGAVAIHLGWRRVDGGLRVATWLGSDGRKGTLILDENTIGGLTRPESLRSTRDVNFNDARAILSKSLEGLETPEWFQQATSTIQQWRSVARLSHLARRWKDSRFTGDESAYEALEAWRYRDYHLWTWEAHQREGALRHRREIYRRFVSQLASEYRTVVLSDFDMRPIARKKELESDECDFPGARSNRHLASTSSLKEAAKSAFADIVDVPAINITHECSACHTVDRFEAGLYIHHACSGCSLVWDQDMNAVENTLAHFERQSDAPGSGIARTGNTRQESAWARRRRERNERLGDAARNVIANAAE